MHHRSSRPSGLFGRKGFTLIELLVVVAIIAILAAMLLPVLDKARARARTSVCMNNLKNLGLAWFMYLNDYEEFFPPVVNDAGQYGAPCYPLAGNYSKSWVAFIAPYVEPVKRNYPLPSRWMGEDFILVCPTPVGLGCSMATGAWNPDLGPDGAATRQRRNYSYMFNYGTTRLSGQKLSTVEKLAPKTRWIMTCYVWGMATTYYLVHPGGKPRYPGFTDGPLGTGGSWINRLYLDGSVHLVHVPPQSNYPYTGGGWTDNGDITPYQ